MGRERDGTGCLIALRRKAGVGMVLFAVVFLIGLLRGEATALAAGEDVCVFMGGTQAPRLFPTDPGDLADPSHDCCDLGLCLAAALLPPAGPAPLALPHAIARLRKARRPRRVAPRSAARDHRQRGPPSLLR